MKIGKLAETFVRKGASNKNSNIQNEDISWCIPRILNAGEPETSRKRPQRSRHASKSKVRRNVCTSKVRILAAAFLNKCVSKAEAENENRQVSWGIRQKRSFQEKLELENRQIS